MGIDDHEMLGPTVQIGEAGVVVAHLLSVVRDDCPHAPQVGGDRE
ncbi:hypothetical protein [Streptomyces sp. GbtcB7]|nr:hypothetical protein [Streptomyces sp. GbtcB7]